MRTAGVLLCLCVLCFFVPMKAYALPGDGGYPGFTADGTYDIDGRPVLVYVTSNGGDVSRTKGSNDDDTQQYTANANSGWKFYKWLTYYDGPTSNSSNPNFTWGSEWCFSKPGDADTEYTSTSSTIQVNREWDARGTYYLYAIFRPELKVQSDVQSTVSFRCTQTTVDSVFASGTGTAKDYAPYNGTVEAQIYIGDRIPVKVTVNNAETSGYSLDGGWIYVNDFTLNRPTEVKITTRGKIQNVSFDANGGVGSMPVQVFYKGEKQKLSSNSFTMIDYEFKSWNTKADGSGDEYTDTQEVSFEPTSDGESITLYAQWKHSAHTGGTATCNELAVCSVCYEEYGSYDKTNHVGDTELRNAAEAEEFKDGYTGDICCLGCGDVLTSGEVIPQTHKHSFVSYVSNSDATCTEDGTETAKCENCSETDTRDIEGSAKGHSFVSYVSNSDATCTEDGTETAKCENCDETDTRDIEGSAKGHRFVNYVSNSDATCTEDGTETAKCENCSETDTRDIEGSAKGHSYSEGKCIVCGKENPSIKKPEDKVPQTGDNDAGMAVVVLFISFLIIVDYSYKRIRVVKK